MTRALIALSALLASTAAAAASTPAAPRMTRENVRIEIGRTNWMQFPLLEPSPRNLPMGAMLDEVEKLLRERECIMRGQSHRSFDITVPWAVQVEADGRFTHLLIADVGCRPLETFVAEMVMTLANRGDIRPAAAPEARWYGSEFNFNLTNITR
jgi:hypothetical protein